MGVAGRVDHERAVADAGIVLVATLAWQMGSRRLSMSASFSVSVSARAMRARRR
jgi:hypothetical protein